MMKNELTLLKDQRVQQSIQGLQKRLATCSHEIGKIKQSTDVIRENLNRQFESAVNHIRAQHAHELAHAITSTDDNTNNTWTKFDTETLKSIDNERKKVKALRAELVSNRETIQSKLKETIQSLQHSAKSERTRLQSAFDSNKEQLRRSWLDNDSVYSELTEFAEKRSIRINDNAGGDVLDATVEGDGSFVAFRQAIQREIDANRLQLSKITKSSIARFSDSWQIWALSLLLGLIICYVVWVTQSDLPSQNRLIYSMIGLAGGSILSGLASFIALRPFIKRRIHSVVPLIIGSHTKVRSMISFAEKHLQNVLSEKVRQIEEKLKNDLANAEQNASSKLTELKLSYDKAKNEVAESSAAQRRDLLAIFEKQFVALEKQGEVEVKSLQQINQGKLHQAHADLQQTLITQREHEKRQTEYMRFRIRHAIEEAAKRVDQATGAVHKFCPPWPTSLDSMRSLIRGQNELGFVPVGSLDVQIGTNFEEALQESETSPLHARLPLVFKLIEHGLLMIRCNSQNHLQAQTLIRNVVLRAFSSLPPGELQVTIIDPDGLGREYSHLMQLADYDPTMVNHRVWTQSVHITEQLAKLSHHTEDVIQQLLRDKYQDIRQYNREAGSMAEPYRLVVWSRFPAGVDESSWRYLSSLISSGGRCGVSTILLVDEDMTLPPSVDLHRFDYVGLQLRLVSNADGTANFQVADPALSQFDLSVEQPPETSIQTELLRTIAEESLKANRVEVPFLGIVPSDAPKYQQRSANGLSIPIGQAGVGRVQHLKLGHGTAQHVLIAGKTGSGKSSLLHTLVSSAASYYSPDELRLVLLDFKKGVEFQVYAETELSHADIIGIESQREFGLSALEYVDRIMQRRGEAFRAAGVQDVPSWCHVRPNEPMPRIMIVIDEFQEIFTEDDKLAQQAAMYLDRIVRQGRSFGIHVILASQTLGGAYSLPRTTLAQMAVRIALQCEGADAMMILSEDNLAAERLRHSGQAVYNDQSGRIEGNQPFQVAYLEKSVQRECLASLPKYDRPSNPMHGGLEKRVVFDGHRKAEWDQANVERELGRLLADKDSSLALLLGDSVSIEPVVACQLHRQAGQNVLIVGNDDENLAAVLRSIMQSFSMPFVSDHSKRKLSYIDMSRDEDVYTYEVMRRFKSSESCTAINGANLTPWITELYGTLQARMKLLDDENSDGASNADWAHEFVVISHLGRLRSLRKNDEFSFGDDEAPKIDKMFQELLRDGPAVGIHFCLGCDNANTVNRWLSRQSMHDFEYRVLMQMSINDSNHLVDSAAANRLDKNVLLFYTESTGIIRKFRPYAVNA